MVICRKAVKFSKAVGEIYHRLNAFSYEGFDMVAYNRADRMRRFPKAPKEDDLFTPRMTICTSCMQEAGNFDCMVCNRRAGWLRMIKIKYRLWRLKKALKKHFSKK